MGKNSKYYWIYDKVFQIFCNSGKFWTQKKACSPSRFRVNGSTPYGKYKPAKHKIGIVPWSSQKLKLTLSNSQFHLVNKWMNEGPNEWMRYLTYIHSSIVGLHSLSSLSSLSQQVLPRVSFIGKFSTSKIWFGPI